MPPKFDIERDILPGCVSATPELAIQIPGEKGRPHEPFAFRRYHTRWSREKGWYLYDVHPSLPKDLSEFVVDDAGNESVEGHVDGVRTFIPVVKGVEQPWPLSVPRQDTRGVPVSLASDKDCIEDDVEPYEDEDQDLGSDESSGQGDEESDEYDDGEQKDKFGVSRRSRFED